MVGTLRFKGYTRSTSQLTFSYGFDELSFTTSLWYRDIDFHQLEATHGLAYMEKVYCHIMAFDINKLVSLQPDVFDLGPFSHLHSPALEKRWRAIIKGVWAQWRYQNKCPDYEGPRFASTPANGNGNGNTNTVPGAVSVKPKPGSVEVLSFCGGGKDSLVAMKLLERAGIDYGAFCYSHSIYGQAKHQHDLITGLLQHGNPKAHHQHWIYEDFMDSPVLDLAVPNVKELTAAETPASLFAVLPVVLQHGYRLICLAHERSANTGNLIWEGEDVNHQWGKSFEAEQMINHYLSSEMVSDLAYFSILQPVYDVLIFNMLRRDLQALPATHSCNIRKPWCGSCPKCAYVWLGYMAWLPPEQVNPIFGDNLFDRPENLLSFRQMLGLCEHTPFECIGQIEETRLAFELCRRKGLTGKAMDLFVQAFPNYDIEPALDHYLDVDDTEARIPKHIGVKVLPQMKAAIEEARAYVVANPSRPAENATGLPIKNRTVRPDEAPGICDMGEIEKEEKDDK